MFENKVIRGIHASRYIMSWVRSGGQLNFRGGYGEFNDWLNTLVINSSKLSDEEIGDILEIARNGKLELEMSAKAFLNSRGLSNI